MAITLEALAAIEPTPPTVRVTRCELERLRRGLSQGELARLVSTSSNRISDLERGRPPGIALATKLQKFFGLSSPLDVVAEVS